MLDVDVIGDALPPARIVEACSLAAASAGVDDGHVAVEFVGAERIAELHGCEVLNEVVLNQVLFRFADEEETRRVLGEVQASGEAWMSGTTWDGRAAIRLSVSGWRTTSEDIDRTLAVFAEAVAQSRQGRG